MQNQHVRRGAIGLAASALALAGIAAAPTSAHAAIDWGQVDVGINFSTYPPEKCHVSGATIPAALELQDNGVPVSQSWSGTVTGSNTENPSEVSDLAASSQITASMTPVGSGPITLKASVSAAASASTNVADSPCWMSASANPRVEAYFTLPQPMWVTIAGSGDGNGNAQAAVFADDSSGGGLAIGPRGQGSTTMLVPAGDVGLQVEARADVGVGDAVHSRSYAGSFTIELAPVTTPAAPNGSGSTVAGSSKGTVVLGARDCASGGIAVALTKKAKKKATQVRVAVNGAKVAKLKGKKLKPRTIVVPAARSAAVEVTVQVKLKNGKKATIKRSYQACA